jgi:hypothetical protein
MTREPEQRHPSDRQPSRPEPPHGSKHCSTFADFLRSFADLVNKKRALIGTVTGSEATQLPYCRGTGEN